MKRRLQRAYDRMTMPENCTQRIEESLQQALQKHKAVPQLPQENSNTRYVSPSPRKANLWGMAAAAVLLVVVLSVGGVGLFLNMPKPEVADPARVTVPPAAEEAVPTTRDGVAMDFYAAVTNKDADVVEFFAERIRRYILERSWDGLAMYLSYPAAIDGHTFYGASEFVDFMLLYGVREDFLEAMEAEKCREMHCSEDGVFMGSEGQVRFEEVYGQLKVTGINGMISDQPMFDYEKLADGGIEIRRYLGQDSYVRIPNTIDGMLVTVLDMAEAGIFRNNRTVKTVILPDGISRIPDYAFADCTNLAEVYVGAGVNSIGLAAFKGCYRLISVYFYADAPEAGKDIFDGADQVTVYYNEPTNGWTENWQGRPTAVFDQTQYRGSRLFEELFIPLAEGKLGKSEREFTEAAQALGLTVRKDNHGWKIMDPESPGSYLAAAPLLDSVGQILNRAEYCLQSGENQYHVSVTNMAKGSYQYVCGSSADADESFGAFFVWELRTYLQTQLKREEPQQTQPKTQEDMQKEAMDRLLDLLSGTGFYTGYQGAYQLAEYYANWVPEGHKASLTHYTAVNMDGTGPREAVLRITLDDGKILGYLVFYHKNDKSNVFYSCVLTEMGMRELKTDGTYLWQDQQGSRGIGSLMLTNVNPTTRKLWQTDNKGGEATYRNEKYEETSREEFEKTMEVQRKKTDVQWLTYPAESRAELETVLTKDVQMDLLKNIRDAERTKSGSDTGEVARLQALLAAYD